jgi:TonB family protein
MKKDIRARRATGLISIKLSFLIIILLAALGANAQNSTGSPQAGTGNDLQRRIARARGLAAIGNLIGAARELEAVRMAAGTDEVIQDVTRVLLIGLYVEQSDYARARMLLDETYNARATGGESAVRAYYTLAGRLLNSARTHLDRYRIYNLNIADAESLPEEARADLDALRGLIGRVVEQSRTMRGTQESAGSTDAAALFEDAATLRASLARDETERAELEREVAAARQRLVVSDTRNAENTRRADAQTRANSPTPTRNSNLSNSSSQPSGTPRSQTLQPQTSANNTANPQNSGPSPSPSPTPANTANNTSQTRTANGNSTSGNSSPVEVGSLVGRAVERIAPSYPQMARSQRVTGTVTVYVVVNEAGEVETISRTSGPALLQRAAQDAARRWRFRPTIVEGRPVRVSGFINFNFTL